MVTKEIILKSIENSIIKTHQRYQMNKKVAKAFKEFADERHGKYMDDEKGLIVDENGKVLAKKNGDSTSVTWNTGDLSLLYELHGDLYHTHSHPNWNKSDFPTCLSPKDCDFPFAKDEYGDFMIKNITAEDTYNGSSMTLIRGDNYDPIDNREDLNKANKRLQKVYSDCIKKYREKYQLEFDKLWEKSGKPSVDSKDYDRIFEEVCYNASMNAYNKSGFEKRLSKVQDLYVKANCRLTLEWREL